MLLYKVLQLTMYYSIFLYLQSMGAEAHINACYKHFFYFTKYFSLVDKRELEPLVMICNDVLKCIHNSAYLHFLLQTLSEIQSKLEFLDHKIF